MQVTDSDNIRQKVLSASQEIALAALMAGATDAEAGDAAGVTRQTISTWKNHNALFIAERNRRQQEIWAASLDRLRSLIPKALDVLDSALSAETPNTRVAMKVIELAGLSDTTLTPVGPTTPDEVLDEEVQRRRDADFDAMIDFHGGAVSDLERARVELEWSNSCNRGSIGSK